MAMNSLRGLITEFGVIVPRGRQHIDKLLVVLADPEDQTIPTAAWTALNTMREMRASLETQIDVLDKEIKVRVRANPTARRLDTIPASARSWPARSPPSSPTANITTADGTSPPQLPDLGSQLRSPCEIGR